MEGYLFVYLYTVLENILGNCILILVITTIAVCVADFVLYDEERIDSIKEGYGYKLLKQKLVIILLAITFLLSTVLPSRQQLLTILGVGTVYAVGKTDIPEDIIKIIDKFLKEELEK
jgi:Ca2+/Na+ antiporter